MTGGSRTGRVLIAVALLIVIVALALWLARVPIATGIVDRTLAAKKVAGSYHIEDLGFGRQRLTNVVIGDPRDPDLVADWVETRIEVGSAGPELAAVAAGQVRLRGRVVNGRVTLGALDRLLPAPSGARFALPAFDLAIEDGRMRLETPAGIVGLRLSGRGGLDDGFRGTLAATGELLALSGCAMARPAAVLGIAIANGAPKIAGPLRIARLSCDGVNVAAVESRVDVALSQALDQWRGAVSLRTGRVSADWNQARLGMLAGEIGFNGTAARTQGQADLRGERFAAAGLSGGALSFAGSWRVAAGRMLASGRVEARDAALAPAERARLHAVASVAAGSPLGPIAAGIAEATNRATRRFDISGEVALGQVSGRLLALVRQVAARSASGATLAFGDGEGIAIGDPAGVRVAGVLTTQGGGLPQVRAALSQDRGGSPISGVARIAPYEAGRARIAFPSVEFSAAMDGAIALRTMARISGPLGDGSVNGLRLPIVANRTRAGAIVVNADCAPVQLSALSVSGLTLGATRLALCPVDGGMFRMANGRISGGITAARPDLTGSLGGSPLRIVAADAGWRHADGRFTLSRISARIGPADARSRLDLGRLDGSLRAGGIVGTFSSGNGQIGNVPLLLSDLSGDWRMAGGVLSLDGAMMVSDAAADDRFRSLAARGVTLRLDGGEISAAGTLFEPAKSVKVADMTLSHVLSTGQGAAHLKVPGITFGDGFQPEELTALTFGVIADVKGRVEGTGDIAWSPDGVTSTGVFRTDGTDLATAFGPVAGIKGEIRFTDLLSLESAPGQVATVASINPGVEVTDGRIEYQTLRGTRIAVTGGYWPFAGGTLTLDPTLLDFSSPQERRMTFRVAGMQARQFLQQFEFKNLDATGVYDGELPMIFDQSGGRIENGKLAARTGGGGLAYLGELTREDLGTWGNIAFQALRSLRYRDLGIVMNGPLAGEMVTEVRFSGISQGEGAKSNFLVRRLQKLPFVFDIRIKAPFRGLIDTAASFYDPKRLIERNLPALIEEQNKRAQPPVIQPPVIQPPVIQPPASENMP